MSEAKERERQFVAALVAAVPSLQGHSVEESEAPDFLSAGPHGVIGIEVTRYTELEAGGRFSAIGQANLRYRVLQTARRLYDQRAARPLYVDVMFHDDLPLTKSRAPQLALELAEFLINSSGDFVFYGESLLDIQSTNYLPEIAGLQVVRVTCDDASAWVTGAAGWAWHVGEHEIARIVAKKESRVVSYRQKCSSIWLLVAFDLYAAGNAIRPPADPVEFTILTSFDRVFCLDAVTSRVISIPTKINA